MCDGVNIDMVNVQEEEEEYYLVLLLLRDSDCGRRSSGSCTSVFFFFFLTDDDKLLAERINAWLGYNMTDCMCMSSILRVDAAELPSSKFPDAPPLRAGVQGVK